MVFLANGICTPGPSDVEQDKKFDPRDAANFRLRLHRCPFSAAEEVVDIFVLLLPSGKPVVPFGGSDEVDFLVADFKLVFISDHSVCFNPFLRIISKDGFLGELDLFPFFFFQQQ